MFDSEFSIIRFLPGLFFIKDSNSNFVNMSVELSHRLGWMDPEQCIGKSDFDIPSKASEIATDFRKGDERVKHTNKKLMTLDVINHESFIRAIISEKSPIEKDSSTYIFYHSIDVTNTHIFKWCSSVNMHDAKFLKAVNKSTSYLLGAECSPLPLTPKQQSCLFLLIRGKNIKQIACILNISVHTATCHIENIKLKLGCNSIPQLIERAIDSGFLYYIPTEFIQM